MSDSCEHGVPFEHPTKYCQTCLRAAMRDQGGVDVRVAGMPFELKVRSFPEWLDKYSADGDTLTVMKLGKGGDVALRNDRTGICYFILARDPR